LNVPTGEHGRDQQGPSLLDRWLSERWFLALWCVVAAFGSYAAMYGFRKPFTAGSYIDATTGVSIKAWLVTAQVLGYTLSKFIGIKVISEMNRERRMLTLFVLIGIAQLALVLFAIVPVPFKAFCLFLNGLPLGMVFGLVLGFLEGRRLTEFFVAGLCASFILADGLTKTVGGWLLESGVTESWMPSIAGLVFVGPLGFFAWMLQTIPSPTAEDIQARSERTPMTGRDRVAMFRRQGLGLLFVVLAYVLITILRSIRADFAPEIWSGMGLGQQPSLFTYSEIWVALGVIVANSLLVLVRDNRAALLTAMVLSIVSLGMAGASIVVFRNDGIAAFPFMVVLGLGMYLPYVAVHTTIFERLIALTRERGNMGFLMYIADAVGYLGYAAVMLGHSFFPSKEHFLDFFIIASGWIVGSSLIALLIATIAFARLHPKLSDGAAALTVPAA
jgi:hypothetical protein